MPRFVPTLKLSHVCWALLIVAAPATAADPVKPFTVPKEIQALLSNYCASCHEENGKGNVNLSQLDKLKLNERHDVLNKVQEQVFFKLMPPAKSTPPEAAEVAKLNTWVLAELRQHHASKFDEKAMTPGGGNFIDHDQLFSGQIKDKAYTPARRWLVSPQIYHNRVLDTFDIKGKERSNPLHGITSPFTLPERSGVRDYDGATLDGGHFVAMQANANWIANKIIGSLRIQLGEPATTVFPNPKDRWYPKSVIVDKKKPVKLLAPLEVILEKKSPPTDEELAAAIQFHFGRALRRQPTSAELQNYQSLMRASIEFGGNIEGLRRMLIAVLLESEFVYRLEAGAGMPDEFGRKLLTPSEASFAIAYALSDQAPDELLLQAARDGKLNTKQDYEREVKRLLSGETLQGRIDATMHEIYPSFSKNNISQQPKIHRFFREFFGYPLATRVFKDVERSDGYFQSPGRGTYGTPGQLIREADLFVEYCLKADKDVIESLLTSQQYYVAPKDNAETIVKGLNELYERFKKDTPWKPLPPRFKPETETPAEDLAFIRKRLNYNSDVRDLSIAMTHTEHFRKLGIDPHPQWNYAFNIGHLTPHANSYNIAPPAWNYPAQQPFAVANRKGILTHPAWLIAHSQNSATDPVRRGKWIREKLLAGNIPDVPITVDAVIPEDPHKTLRDRLIMATNKQECMKCHQHMNPLGVAFENYDDFGRFRTLENLEHPANVIAKAKAKYGADTYKTAPVVTTSRLDGTGDPNLDGEVKDSLDLIDRLAKSKRVRQSIIRHAFRFFLGRNEMLSDSQTLIDAENAYVQSGGSFKAVVLSLLTSDSFMYRK
ncbi:hypothetical protein BH11PLA2_BH11PLA2_02960 [soil metagenome]